MAKKLKWPKLPHVEVPLYGGRVHVARTRQEYQQATAYLKAVPMSDARIRRMAGLTGEFIGNDGDRLYLIGIFDGTARTLVHELGHVVFSILDTAGVPTGKGKREAFCYLQDFLYGAIVPAIRKGAA